MLFTILFLSCNEDVKYTSSDPSNCTAEFCEEDFDEGSGNSQDTENPSTDDTFAGNDTSDENDTAGGNDTADSNENNPQGPDDDAQGGNEGFDGDDTGYEHEDSGFHKESEECGCANPEGEFLS